MRHCAQQQKSSIPSFAALPSFLPSFLLTFPSRAPNNLITSRMILSRAGSRAASLLGGAARRAESGAVGVRQMSSGHSVEQEIAECNKWRNVTMVATPVCLAASAYFYFQPHHHYDKPVEYSYLHIRSKGFPWGDCGLFEQSCWEEKK